MRLTATSVNPSHSMPNLRGSASRSSIGGCVAPRSASAILGIALVVLALIEVIQLVR